MLRPRAVHPRSGWRHWLNLRGPIRSAQGQ